LAPADGLRDRELEILVLRHQVKVLKRKAGGPGLRRRDRLFLAVTAGLLPRERPSCVIASDSFTVGRRFSGRSAYCPS
jgi:hypothetical protein